ncbi:MAG: (2Fe-2S)-binding protein [Acidobacteria bacterium]|nr:(2Fe-2S)-binding protein [Acidobacteriota bacterium]
MRIRIDLNGREVEADTVPHRSLASFLRNELGLTGTKLSCEVGECGSCTVLLDGRPVTSCLVPVAQADGRSVQTIEGLGINTQMHPLQEAFVGQNAVQCGFCIPGMIMAAKALLDRKPDASSEDVRLILSGNLCRCTGYQKIVEAVVIAAREVQRNG